MKYKVTLNNRVYEVEVEQGEAMLVNEYELAAPAVAAPAAAPVAVASAAAPAAAPAAGALAAGEVITSPMPGNILSVNVSAGDTVKKGQVLMILEAMKMENEIMSPCDGKVVSVSVAKGAAVESGTLLCVIG